ncbi:MAG TPA: FAD-dependent monooxygenase [Dinghuibacter sp.]|uniref:FAD-dependent monooxygenase n=1 Tax=Dinghuibacter sp. TaxID=2024697 RepID=UPI002B99159B|nr:FAD-dependent monooxygenase [Dinghuibacter sp.]HTJ14135.1 FAD-dependent monooxygenase [Dinghuibacter sp.]
METVDILIVGAGPTGLMMATQLGRWGADFLLIDQKAGPTRESRALAVQARSLEIYEQMGLSDEVLRDGHVTEGIRLYERGEVRATVFLGNLQRTLSPFPFVLVYEQSKNEAILARYLQTQGREVRWNTALKGVTRQEGRYRVETDRGLIECRYLVACDGARSPLREWSGMPFTGGTYEQVFYVADTHADALFGDRLSLFLGRSDFTMIFPMPGERQFRVLGTLPPKFYHQQEIGFDAIEAQVQANMKLPVTFYDTSWYSTYKLHHKKVEHFRKENLFFVGDAAHIHSPAGGQGMNTGLQDAYNLAWKLALVSKGRAKDALLDTYHEERNPVAEQLLRFTDRLFTEVTHFSFFSQILKRLVLPNLLPVVNRVSAMRRTWFRAVSQIQISYRRSSLSQGRGGNVRAGDRFPYFVTTRGQSVYQLIREHHVKPFLVIVCGLEPPVVPDALCAILTLDAGGAGLPETFVAIVRPDVYIGYIADTLLQTEINDWFRRIG